MNNKNDNLFDKFEQIEIDNIPKVLPRTLKDLKEPLTEYVDGQSVIRDTDRQLETQNIDLGLINGSNDIENTLTGQSNTQSKQRVLTKEMHGGINMNSSHSQSVSNDDFTNYSNFDNNVSHSNGSSNVSNSMWGFTDTAILLSIAVLIALVFLVSTAAIMYFGLK